MLIRFEISDSEGRGFKDKCVENRTTMSKVIRKFIKIYTEADDSITMSKVAEDGISFVDIGSFEKTENF